MIHNNHYELSLPNNLNIYQYPIELYTLNSNIKNVKILKINTLFLQIEL